ncbi:hypothetical protein TBLA_0B09700 [Henningerozyma blattae CBS 6284]|uniref:Uncharacterized protein n=1 Tax=Henningerozyma blattae (strain ATCC 34711 / CBS 6284 / DSM 70876 / NBRC 10599 / NRRL Y-10934 / UCD 77-7) TaxID=1071380 RepID=I2H084_HENB6|nr:hypothetical protein TBLA_0B09700 [Tetrapisispora blattae CBS 6284]CCH59786.1 hypothetical protein TBLA_0B09700 [Tetrapisispora blattae CBS 6284]
MWPYKVFCTVGTSLILISSSFMIGLFFAFQAYDFNLLFNKSATQEQFQLALEHYQRLNDIPRNLIIVICFIYSLGLIGSVIRIYKPNPDLTYFEYASLALYVLGMCVFLTNIRTGIECTITGNWGEVTENQGLQVIASSNIILIVLFLGVLVLQAALWYTEYDLEVRLKAFYEREAAAQRAKYAKRAEDGDGNKSKPQKKDTEPSQNTSATTSGSKQNTSSTTKAD